MGNVYMKFNYDRLHTDKALGNFRKSDNNNNIRSDWGHFLGPKIGPMLISGAKVNRQKIAIRDRRILKVTEIPA